MKRLKNVSLFTIIVLISIWLWGCAPEEEDNVSDATNPTVDSIFPSDGYTDVTSDTTVTVNFSQSMDATTITTNSSDTTCDGTVQISKNNFSSCVKMMSDVSADDTNESFIVQPAANLNHDTTYKIRVTDAATNSIGFAMEEDYETSTGIKIITLPAVESVTPSDGGTELAVDSTIYVTFNKEMDSTSLSLNDADTTCSGTFQLSSDNFSTCVKMASTINESSDGTRYWFSPASELTTSTTYKLRVTSSVRGIRQALMGTDYEMSTGFKTSSSSGSCGELGTTKNGEILIQEDEGKCVVMQGSDQRKCRSDDSYALCTAGGATAEAFCGSTDYFGSSWYLPNETEAGWMYAQMGTGSPESSNGFCNSNSSPCDYHVTNGWPYTYWTRTEVVASSTYRRMDFSTGSASTIAISSKASVRCIRRIDP